MTSSEIVVTLLATGGRCYTQYVGPLVASLKKFFPPHDVVLFTDGLAPSGVLRVHQPRMGWPRVTLMRYHALLKQRDLLSQYRHIFYMDVDMLVESKIASEEIVADGITAVLHPGFPTTFERRVQSTAYVKGNPHYYQGCFVGGPSDIFLDMCGNLARSIDIDDARGIVATWHDESHLNRYLTEHPPAKVLSPAYAFPDPKYLKDPETWLSGSLASFIPKIRHLEKIGQRAWKS